MTTGRKRPRRDPRTEIISSLIVRRQTGLSTVVVAAFSGAGPPVRDAVIAKVVRLHGVVSVSVAGGWNQT